ncbi:prepilin-type N-terminal cleavage/methylation domain-containing protein [Acetobacterium paludosum]|uniref:Prepilin-type N-terminal cleavage/methylation domain-containing protein n=1 Tax=Acetobacterium paludosum TaxID=52693 RepID=A0A923I3G1_9FIRM|nr:prepilin-type N-terminal cleavage/methylation domain-containing protein [Acetobacterium paludosum]MBC3889258.1 prepilin-type N-terminal cleavage/methylation domain-containing protein [Acetobacterium paludosum]
MKRIISNQSGVTLIELLVAFLILSIILTTIVGALMFMQKSIIGSDLKNNEAAKGQDYVDQIVTMLSNGTPPALITEVGTDEKGKAYSMDNPKLTDITTKGQFYDDKWATYPRQFYIVEYPGAGGYNIYYRGYYDNGTAQINYTAFAKKV